MEDGNDDLRSTIEAAFAEKPVETSEPESTGAVESKASPPVATEAPVVESKPPVAKDGDTATPAKDEPAPTQGELPLETPKETYKPPVSWKAGAKERWKDIPDEIKQEVLRRETEINRGLQQAAEGRKFAEQFQQTVEPFRAIMAVEGVTDPMVAVRNLMQTAATLRMGSALEKANTIAQLIAIYGVDIPVLDSILSGQAAPQVKQQTELDRLLQERLAPYQQFMQQIQQQQQVQQQVSRQEAARVVDDFAAKHEFVNDPDIANTMADLLEVAANRGRELSIDRAYEIAVQQHPEISKIVSQRKAAEAAAAGAVQKAKLAASSVPSTSLGGVPTESVGDDLRATIEAAWNRKI